MTLVSMGLKVKVIGQGQMPRSNFSSFFACFWLCDPNLGHLGSRLGSKVKVKGQGQSSRSKVKVVSEVKVILALRFLCVARSVRPRSRAVKVECQGHVKVKGQCCFKVIAT